MIRDLMEVILYVEDMDAQVRFYRDTLGLPVTYPAGLEDYGDQAWVTLATGPCALALHAGGQRRFGQDAPQLVFRVDEIHAAHQALSEQGVEIGEARSPAPGIWVADARDPEGNRFSIESHEE